MNRRQFLKQSARAAAGIGIASGFPTIVSASALGRDGQIAPSNRIVMGAIGLGWMGEANMHSFLGKKRVQMIALCDVDRPLLDSQVKHVNKRYDNSDCVAYDDFREIIARKDLDAITIALPDHWHAIPAIMATRAGLDVYGEKPLSRTLHEGRAMCNAVKQHGRIWQTGSWQRSRDEFYRGVQLVRNGRIGKIRHVEVGLGGQVSDFGQVREKDQPEKPPAGLNWDMWLGPAPEHYYCQAIMPKNWRWIMDYGGGMLMDWVGHHVDIAHWGLDMDQTGPIEVEATATMLQGLWNVPVDFDVYCTYANGISLRISHTFAGGTKWIGDDGWVHVNRGSIDAHPKSLLNDVIGPEEIQVTKSTDHYDNFLDCVRSRTETITPCETAHRSASVGHLGMIAIQTGRKIYWNPETETFTKPDPDAERLLSYNMRSPWTLS